MESVSYINERSGTFATEGGLRLAQAELNDVPLLREGDIVIVRAGLEEATKGRLKLLSPFWMGRIELDEVAQLGMRANTFAFCVSLRHSVELVCLVK